MDKERDAIKTIHERLGNIEVQKVFDCDAQLFKVGSQELLFTVDEYSAEDFFIDDDPFRLGWNLAAATLSDILAAGGIPLFFGHSMTIPATWDQLFLEGFSNGLKEFLSVAKADFIGGDTGFGENWKYTGIALGKPIAALNRAGASAGDIIFMTGKVGAGNLEAAVSMYGSQPEFRDAISKLLVTFPFRGREAETIRKYASSCIDSSDGMLKSLLNLAQSSQLGFLVDHLPYLEEGLHACNFLKVNKTLLFIGACGEYELVFSVPENREKELLEVSLSKGLNISRIGKMTGHRQCLFEDEGQRIDFKGYNLHARNFRDKTEYLNAINDFLAEQMK